MTSVQDARPQYLLALGQLEKLFAEITPEALDRPTPCTEFTLRQLLGHVVGGVHRFAYLGEEAGPRTSSRPPGPCRTTPGRARWTGPAPGPPRPGRTTPRWSARPTRPGAWCPAGSRSAAT